MQSINNWFMGLIGIGELHDWKVKEIRSLDGWEFQGFPSDGVQAKRDIIAAIKNEGIHSGSLNLFASRQPLFPPVIWKLTGLVSLNLALNSLESIPPEIGALTHLTELMLYNNHLISLPSEIGNLTRLIDFRVHNNQITSLPSEIGRLTHLKELFLCINDFESIPAEIGLCTSLVHINIRENRRLTELPISLGQIPGLTDLAIVTTGISNDLRLSILNQCRSLRHESVADVLPGRLRTWQTMAGVDLDTEGLIHSDINEWLVRLERTRDYSRSQKRLAGIVCRMLQSVRENEAFRELFFVQVAANNMCCEDRAAMSLNEIYTSWKSGAEDLKIMTGVAKTLALRKELAKQIPPGERESVEIYLYYETLLKEHLCTAIEGMAYEEIGKRDWIDPEQLLKRINETYFDHLIDLPAFERLAKKELKEEWEGIQSNALNELTDRPAGDDLSEAVLMRQYNQGKVMQEMNAAWSECVKRRYLHVVN